MRSAGANHVSDPLEDTNESHIWRWELRDVKVLPKVLRGQAQGIKKALHEVSCFCMRCREGLRFSMQHVDVVWVMQIGNKFFTTC